MRGQIYEDSLLSCLEDEIELRIYGRCSGVEVRYSPLNNMIHTFSRWNIFCERIVQFGMLKLCFIIVGKKFIIVMFLASR